MKRIFSIVGFGFVVALCSCAAAKTLRVTGGSKSDGVITMAYQYGLFEKPAVEWGKAQATAVVTCQGWGYSNAQFFEQGTRTCIQVNKKNNCISWRVEYNVQCLD
jgi:predicted methyltransferase